MKSKRVFFVLALLLVTHYIHYKWNQLRQPFYNTVFSTPDLPRKFYYVNIGDSRAKVEKLIGQPFSNFGERINYSKPGNAFFNNYSVYFQIVYVNDTVADKFVAVDD